MKYKYSRKVIAENIKTYLGLMHLPYEAQKLAEDLLAQNEDRKGWIPCNCPKGGIDGDGLVCDKCGGTEWVKVKSTPSPLEIEEVSELMDFGFNEAVTIRVKLINRIIRNQNQIISYLKQK